MVTLREPLFSGIFPLAGKIFGYPLFLTKAVNIHILINCALDPGGPGTHWSVPGDSM